MIKNEEVSIVFGRLDFFCAVGRRQSRRLLSHHDDDHRRHLELLHAGKEEICSEGNPWDRQACRLSFCG